MKYTHLGFSQKIAIDMGLDDKDLAILRWFIDFKDSKKIAKRIFDNEVFYWVKYDAIIEEYPIFKFKKDTVYRRLKAMVNAGILKHRTLKQGGVWSYYALGEKYIELLSDKEINEVENEDIKVEEIKEKEVGFKSEPFGNESEGNGFKSESNGLKPGTKNPSTISIYYNNYSANDAQDIWDRYPNKKGKAIALKKIPKLLQQYGKDHLVRCVDRYAKETKGIEKQFILNGSTFFNGRYEDYLDCNSEPDKPKIKKLPPPDYSIILKEDM